MSLTVKQARLLSEKTQEQMASALSIHVDTYRKLEENPEKLTIKQARIVCAELGQSFDTIFFTR